jgi:ATP-dependent protease ClpP protease subunit
MNEITLYGTVGASFWDEDYFTAAQVRDMLKGREGPLTVRINSGGGIATEGQAIYTALKDYSGEVHIVVDGVAASAASLIAMAGDKITMRLGSWMLIHDPAQMFGYGRGTAEDHRELAVFLDKIGDGYAQVYAARAGIELEAARDIMRAETVYLGDEAVGAGFATEFEGSQAAAAASFDYRIYAHAPQAARDASSGLASRQDQMAVLAAIAGFPRQNGEKAMPDPKNPAAEKPTAQTAPKVDAPNADLKPDAPAPVAPTMSAVQVSMLHEMAVKAGVSGSIVTAAIKDGASFEDAVLKLNAAWVDAGDSQEITMPGRPTSRILRDERETTRAAMTDALHAQMSSTAQPSDAARRYMQHSIVDMAAECVDYRGPVRTAGDRLRVLEMASHSTSDFPAIFENALNKTLLERYNVQEPTYRSISRRRDFNDFRPHPMVRAGDFPSMQPVAEGGEIKMGTFGESRETALLGAYGIGLTITRQMMINDEMGAIEGVLADYGSMIANFEEETFYAFMAAATLADGNLVFRTQRGNLASSGSVISVDNVGKGKASVKKQTSIGGQKLTLNPTILLVGPDQELAAAKIVTAVSPTQATEANPYAGRMSVLVSAHITGNEWYLFTPPAQPGGAVFTYGFLNGASGPRIRTDEPFGRQGMSLSVEHDFGLGAIDFRGAWKNPGAAS